MDQSNLFIKRSDGISMIDNFYTVLNVKGKMTYLFCEENNCINTFNGISLLSKQDANNLNSYIQKGSKFRAFKLSKAKFKIKQRKLIYNTFINK